MTKLTLLSLTLLLTSCLSQDPGVQCLNSFKSTLKDPDSGKVISFTPPILIYTATNTYGARVQGKALCKIELDKKWARDTHAEYAAIQTLSIEKLGNSNKCRASGKAAEECTGGSTVLKLSAITLKSTDIEALHDESRNELGF